MLSVEDADRLRQLEESLWRAESRFDGERMRQVLAPDFLEFGRSGRVYRLEDALAVERQEIPATLPPEESARAGARSGRARRFPSPSESRFALSARTSTSMTTTAAGRRR